jgi:hypothetical protein
MDALWISPGRSAPLATPCASAMPLTCTDVKIVATEDVLKEVY